MPLLLLRDTSLMLYLVSVTSLTQATEICWAPRFCGVDVLLFNYIKLSFISVLEETTAGVSYTCKFKIRAPASPILTLFSWHFVSIGTMIIEAIIEVIVIIINLLMILLLLLVLCLFIIRSYFLSICIFIYHYHYYYYMYRYIFIFV